MRRLLLTLSDTRCPFGCRYCFANFSQYERPLDFTEAEKCPDLFKEIDVIYPACDVDLFATRRPLEILHRAASLGPSISISTKARLSVPLVEEMASLVDVVKQRGKVLKIGISLSTKRLGKTLEPRAADYSTRIRNLQVLQRAGIPTCLVLKPILVDIAVEEYLEILSDVAGLAEDVLIGDEYLDILTARIAPPAAEKRLVEWAPRRPEWPVRQSALHVECIKTQAQKLGLRVFDSDLDLMAALVALHTRELCYSQRD